MIIAVDFDGTIVEHRFPKIGKPIPFAFDVLKQLQHENHILILWTVREGKFLQDAVNFCAENGLYFFAHNDNFPDEERNTTPRKLNADLFIDDRNFGGLPNWEFIYKTIYNNETFDLFKPTKSKSNKIKKYISSFLRLF